MMTVKASQIWLRAGAAALVVFGVLLTLAALPATSAVTRILFDIVFWPVDGGQSIALPETRLANAMLGGVMMGWGVMLWLLAGEPYLENPRRYRPLLLAGVGTWFVADSLGSAMAGAPLNIACNVGFLLVFFVPLVLVRLDR